jgi:hypothetical protein
MLLTYYFTYQLLSYGSSDSGSGRGAIETPSSKAVLTGVQGHGRAGAAEVQRLIGPGVGERLALCLATNDAEGQIVYVHGGRQSHTVHDKE